MRVCKYCGVTEEETRIINNDICRKHYFQIRKYGTVHRSIYESNEITITGNTATMYLYNKKGVVVGQTIFDSCFVSEVAKVKWYLKHGYVRGTTKGKKIFLHRMLTNCPNNKVVDHIDRNPLNNLSVNLRVCSQAENTKNRKYSKALTNVGVRKVPSGRWSARITVMYKTIYLGTFGTLEEAIDAREKAENHYFNSFSCKELWSVPE